MAVFYSQNRPNTNKNKTHKVSTPKVPSQRRSTPLEPNFHKGKWPRNGHPEKLLNHFAERRPPILTWAHSSFEQGSLPLTLWRRIPLNELPEGCAIRTWLDDKRDLPPAADPGGSDSPHCVCEDKSTVLLDSLDCWALIKSARGDPLSNNVLMALRILAYTMTVDQLRMLAGFLLGDDTATWFPHSKWLGIVSELLAGHPLLRVGSHADLTNLFMLVPEGSTHLMASTAQGHLVAAWEVRSLQPDSHPEFFPMEIVAPSTGQVRNQLPEKVEVECTGLGGHDLGRPIP